ncbi:oxaloacetate decarboxylase, gamma subunit [Marinospirillum celere]|uniref:Probable oxaloacetate decarboxylase gamma chain n=1 Tax=Marinospirillum celere TaxID=1122252 RepID=A0A1I1ITW3_9GAMM|nr:OadG family transporter subunit [Marinospirillum celere]SFC39351.1 oxaloacetate decarboxylase, gamma subunit [Marinospirillum celere]
MQDPDLIAEGFNLMLLGMGFVFMFLTVLVIATTLMSKTINRFFPSPEEAVQAGISGKPAAQLPSDKNPEIIAVISAALHLHRQRKQ